jgi:phage-related minor tail protein
MSEKGPEAVVPLGKTKDGKLGITMSGSASGSIFAPHIEVNVQNTGTGEMSEDQAKRLGTQLDAMVKVEVAEAMYDWKRKKAI